MPHDHVETVQRAVAAFNAADVDGFRKTFSAEPSITPLRAALETDVRFAGPGAVEEFWAAAQEDWADTQLDVESVERVGDRVLLIARYSGRTRASAVPFTQRIGVVVDFEDGQICRLTTYVDPDDALEAVGRSD